jgi:hypothetical protein
MSTTGKAPKAAKMFSMEEVAEHNTEEDCWLVYRGKCGQRKVYDTTKFLVSWIELQILRWKSSSPTGELHPPPSFEPNSAIFWRVNVCYYTSRTTTLVADSCSVIWQEKTVLLILM